MKRKLMTSSVIVSLTLVADAAVTTDPASVSGGTMHFEGESVNTTCAVNIQLLDQVVALDQYRTASPIAVGDTTTQTPFSIVLNDCDPKAAATAAVAFSDQSNITNNDLLVVTFVDNGTTADGVRIETLDNISTVLKPDGATFPTAQALVEGTNTLRPSTRYKVTATSVTPGQVDADATFIMEYK